MTSIAAIRLGGAYMKAGRASGLSRRQSGADHERTRPPVVGTDSAFASVPGTAGHSSLPMRQ